MLCRNATRGRVEEGIQKTTESWIEDRPENLDLATSRGSHKFIFLVAFVCSVVCFLGLSRDAINARALPEEVLKDIAK